MFHKTISLFMASIDKVKHITGGETAYCGYSRVDPERKILVYLGENTEPVEFLDYLEKVIQKKDKKLYDQIAENAKKMVKTQYDWDPITRNLSRIYEELGKK